MTRIDITHRMWLWLAGAAAAVALAFALVPSSAAAAGRPSCASVSHTTGWVTQTVTIRNHCSYTLSFVVHRFGPDSPCLHVSPGHYRYYRWGNGLNYYGTSFGCD
jgi:hypothetical protein